MLNSLETNLRYLQRVTQEPDDGFLALGTPERREQEEYFDKSAEARAEENDELSN